MPDEDLSAVGSPSESGPDSGDSTTSGDNGDGADDRGQAVERGGEKPSSDTPTDNDTQSDSDDALIDALAAGKMDEVDANGDKAKAKKPDAKAKPEDKADEEAEGDKKPEDAKPDEYDPDEKALIEKARTKGERKDLDKLFKERRELRHARGFADAVVKHASEADLIRVTDKGMDTTGLQNLIETEKRLKAMAPKDQAEHFRKLADKLYPQIPAQPPTPVELPQDLKDAVDAGYLKKADADMLAEKRLPPKPEEKPPDTEKPVAATGPSQQEVQKGFASIADVAKGYKERFGADWDSVAAKVEAALKPRLKNLPPSAWGDVAELVMKAEAAERKQAIKKPVTTTRPSGTPVKRPADLLSEEDELEALSKGRSI